MKLGPLPFLMALALASCSKPASEILTIDVAELASAPAEDSFSWEDIASVDGFFELDPGHTLILGGYLFYEDYADGHLLIGDPQNKTILSVDESGRIVSTVSRSGNGPQEYLGMSSCYFLPDGNIALRDATKNKEFVYRPDGTFVSSADSFGYDGYVFSDGSRALMEMKNMEDKDKRQFRVYSAQGDTLLAGPVVDPGQKIFVLNGGHFMADGPDACWFCYMDSDTLYHVRTQAYSPAVIFTHGSQTTYGETAGMNVDDGKVRISMKRGRFQHYDRFVTGRYFMYQMMDTELNNNHFALYRTDTQQRLYHSSEAPVAKVNGTDVQLWPIFVKDGLIWCRVSRDSAPLLIKDYDDDDNDVLVRLKLKR